MMEKNSSNDKSDTPRTAYRWTPGNTRPVFKERLPCPETLASSVMTWACELLSLIFILFVFIFSGRICGKGTFPGYGSNRYTCWSTPQSQQFGI